MQYDWSWNVFLETAPDGVHSYLGNLVGGLGWTLCLSAATAILALCLGSVIGTIRTLPSRAFSSVGTAYVELFRNIPLLVQMFLWYFVLPEIVPSEIGQAIKQMQRPYNTFVPALICFSCYGGARIGEQIRAGIQSLPAGQFQAATALGLTTSQAYRRVVLPEAFRIVIPSLTSELTSIVKYSSVALTIGLLELTGQARAMQEFSFHIFEAFSAATLGYLIINGLLVSAMGQLERWLAVPGLIGARSTPRVESAS
ncbi:glutamate/aspartate transport system permease protein [Bradyrhizobium sp. GM5.1]